MTDQTQSSGIAKIVVGVVAATVVLLLLCLLRANLPPDDVSKHLNTRGLEQSGLLEQTLGKAATRLVTSDWVADWEYQDWLLFKTARSKRLERSALALPFSGWTILADQRK